MKIHKDSDDEMPTELNKTIKATYGLANKRDNRIGTTIETALIGASPTSTGDSVVEASLISSSTDIDGNKQTNDLTPRETVTASANDASLHGVPSKETDMRCETTNHKTINPEENSEELHGVPIDTDTAENSLDNSTLNDDSTLPTIEPTREKYTENNQDINLQENLSSDKVTMDIGILEELSEFGNLELDDHLDIDLPLVGAIQNREQLEPEVDLEIAMDNVRFLEENPIVQASVSTTRNSRSTQKQHTSTNQANSDTPNNDKSQRMISPRGVIKITSHVLRKPTPDEKKGKKFKCEACPFIGYSRGAVSDH